MADKLQETVNRENALHGETLIEDQASPVSADGNRSSDSDKREELKARIEAGQRRNEQRSFADQARDAADAATQFAKEHPIATVVGGLALGLLVGSMTRGGRRVGRRVGRSAGDWASTASDAALAFTLGLLDDATDLARHGKDAVSDAGERMALGTRELKRDADHYTRSLADRATTGSRLTGRSLSRRLRDT